jgi:hypothetical protein
LRFTAAYYLFLIYITVIAKPLIPIVADAFHHEFDGLEHISLVHAVYGENHLQKELADTAANEQGKNQNSVKFQDDVSFHLVYLEMQHHFAINISKAKYLLFKPCKLPLVFISQQGPPPKSC